MKQRYPSKSELKRKVSELTAAHEVGKIFNAILDHDVLFDFFLLITARALKADSAHLYFLKEDKLCELSHWGKDVKDDVKTSLFKGVEKSSASARPIVSGSFLCVPLIIRDKVIGVAGFTLVGGTAFSKDEEVELAMAYANQAASAMKNLELYEENLKYEKLAAVGQTIGMLSHEVKNVLQCIRTNEYLVDKGFRDGKLDKTKESWERLKKDNERLNDFALNMLRLTKVRNPVYEKIAINDILSDLAKDIEEKAKRTGIEFLFKPDEKLSKVKADSQGIYSVVLNLVVNAIEACKERGRVELSTRAVKGGNFQISVSDTGLGIPKNELSKIFQIFYSTKGVSGTGLGLALVDRVAKEHNGKIDVDSEPGKGTTFTITLPT